MKKRPQISQMNADKINDHAESAQPTPGSLINVSGDGLMDRVVSILEQARANVVRAVNSNMVIAYWLIGCEIVQELQRGEDRAGYGKQVIETLCRNLTKRYGEGFSTANLKNFRQFYLAYPDRIAKKSYQPGSELIEPSEISYLSGSNLNIQHNFHPHLTWSHYRALMRVHDNKARRFYEQEAIDCGWNKVQLERQIHSSYYHRILSNRGEAGLTDPSRERLPGEPLPATTVLKSPYVLEFLGLPDPPHLHESSLEQAIIDNLQHFLLELGKGFSFVARQKQLRFDDESYYVDLVFYNFILKCFLLIDLKIGKLTHQDVGQMDGYVRMYEDRFKVPGDNPTIGLILCSDKSESVAKYSVLSDRKQIFASHYMDYLPSEEELQREVARERALIEANEELSADEHR